MPKEGGSDGDPRDVAAESFRAPRRTGMMDEIGTGRLSKKKKRYVVVNADLLYVFKNADADHAEVAIPLAAASIDLEAPDRKSVKHCIRVAHGDSTVFFFFFFFFYSEIYYGGRG